MSGMKVRIASSEKKIVRLKDCMKKISRIGCSFHAPHKNQMNAPLCKIKHDYYYF